MTTRCKNDHTMDVTERNSKLIPWHSARSAFRGFFLTVTLVHLFVGIPYARGGGRCRFPVEWKGRYFQSGLGYIIIRDKSVTTKGTCIGQHRDYYLFANRENDCHQCLLMIRRHANVLQYKESFCLSPDSLKTVCSQIRIETTLHTLVRDPATPIPCPFQDAYYFDYSDIQHGFCGQSISYAKPCVGATKYQFHFKHCVDSASLNRKDFDLVCVATWKDGSESYLYTRVTGSGIIVKDDQYRCFNYQHYDSEVFLVMSGDATCRGLRSARDGQLVLELTKDAFGYPPPSCHFPDWMKSFTFRDLEGKHSYVLSENSEVLSEFYFKRSREHLQSDYKCLEKTSALNTTGVEFAIRAHGTHGCISKVECLRFRQISPNVIEFQKGVSPGLDETTSRCRFSSNYRTLIVEHSIALPSKPSICPHPGIYETTAAASSDSGLCLHRLTVGCSNRSRVEVNIGCERTNKNNGALVLECITSWQSSEKLYVILRELGSRNRLTNCFSFATNRDSLSFEFDRVCNDDVTAIEPRLSSLSFTKIGECDAIDGKSSTLISNTIIAQATDLQPTRNPLSRLSPSPPGDHNSVHNIDNDLSHKDDQNIELFRLKSPKPVVVHPNNDVIDDVIAYPVTKSQPEAGDLPSISPYSSREHSEAVDAHHVDSPPFNRKSKERFGYGTVSGFEPDAEVKEARVDVRELDQEQGGALHIHYVNTAAAINSVRVNGGLFFIVLSLVLFALSEVELYAVLR